MRFYVLSAFPAGLDVRNLCADARGRRALHPQVKLCGRGQWCMSNGTCQKPGNENDACSDTRSCRSDLECNNGTCAARPSTSGATCVSTAQLGCAIDENLTCLAGTTPQCIPVVWASTGQSCPVTSTQATECTMRGTCNTSLGTCTAGPTDHGTCDPSNDECEWPARCSPQSSTCVMSGDVPTCN